MYSAIGALGRSQFGSRMLFEPRRKISTCAPTAISPPVPSWTYLASDMCLEIDSAPNATPVSGIIPPRYMEYMSQGLDEPHRVFAREIIRRPGLRGWSTPLRPGMEKYDAIAISGKSPLFPTLSIFGDERFYAAARIDSIRHVEICDSKTGIGRVALLRGLSCAACLPDLEGCKLELAGSRIPRGSGGEYVALSDGLFFAICIDAPSGGPL